MYKRFTDNNGLNVIVSPMSQMASVSIGIWIGVGGRYESDEESGISHLVEHMLFKGTHKRSARGLKEAVEGIGGAFNGFTSDEVTCYMVKVPAKYMELGVDILSDMVLNSRLDANDLVSEKFVVCEEIKMYRDQPAEHVLDILGSIMWPGNALGRPLTGTMATVKSFKRDKLMDFTKDYYQPANISVVAAGKTNPENLFKYASKMFKDTGKKKKHRLKPSKIVQQGSRVKISRGNTNQTHIAMGFHAEGRNLRERFALKMMNVILGGNMSSRLFEELREKNGLCYDISSSYKRHSDIGEVHIHAGVDNKKASKSVLAILTELGKIKENSVTPDELKRAKEYAKGQFLIAMEGTSTRMMWLGDRFMVHNDIPKVKDILKYIDAVDARDIKEICGELFRASAVNLAMISNIDDKEKNIIRKGIDNL
ncbi:MAG: pitrilysin family protein [Candidatus Omnitrophota bacterium]